MEGGRKQKIEEGGRVGESAINKRYCSCMNPVTSDEFRMDRGAISETISVKEGGKGGGATRLAVATS